MMPVIRISDDTFAMLQQLGRAFVDTPDTVVSRLAKAELLRRGQGVLGADDEDRETLELAPHQPEDLTHTRLRYARLGDQEFLRPHWNQVVREAHAIAKDQLGSFEALRAATSANIRQGRYEDHGFVFIPGADISIQGADANQSWQHLLRLAQKLVLSVEVRFEWYEKETAAHPGKRGRLAWSPPQAKA